MKKIVFSVIAACSLFALFGCNHRAETDTVQPAAMEELADAAKLARRAALRGLRRYRHLAVLEKDGTG